MVDSHVYTYRSKFADSMYPRRTGSKSDYTYKNATFFYHYFSCRKVKRKYIITNDTEHGKHVILTLY